MARKVSNVGSWRMKPAKRMMVPLLVVDAWPCTVIEPMIWRTKGVMSKMLRMGRRM